MNEAWFPLNYHEGQQAYLRSKARFNSLVCGRGAGKTEIAMRKLANHARNPASQGAKYLFLAPTMRQAKKIAWERLKALVGKEWTAGRPNESELRIKTVSGGMIQLDGLDQPHRVEGEQVDGVIIDESSDVKLGAYQRTVMPMLTWRNAWCDRIGVPKLNGPSGRDYKSFFDEGMSDNFPEKASFHWPSWEVCPAEAIEQMRHDLSPQDFREQCGAEWITFGGTAFHSFDVDRNVRPCGYNPKLPIRVGSDFNVNPMCWVLSHWCGNHYEFFDEIVDRNTHTQKTLNLLRSKYPHHTGGWEFYGDASAKARKTSSGNTDYLVIQNDPDFIKMGRTVHYNNANPRRDDRFKAFNAMLFNASGEIRIYMDPRCKRLIDDMQTRGTDEKQESGTDVGHMSDAASYIVHKTHPLRPPRSQSQIITRPW